MIFATCCLPLLVAVYSVVIPVPYPGCSVCRACANAWNAHAAEDNLLYPDDCCIFDMKTKATILNTNAS